MSDQYEDSSLNFDESGGEQPAQAKPKGGGSGILRILMFVGIALALIALIVTIVVVTVSVLNGRGSSQTALPVSEAYQASTPAWATYKQLPSIRARSADPEPRSVVVKVVLGYDERDKELPNEILQRDIQIQDSLRNFFSRKLAEELTPQRESILKEEIRQMLNWMVEKGEIRAIYFEDLQVIEQ